MTNDIKLHDHTTHTVQADRWHFDAADVMHFYQDGREVFSRQWKEIQFIYSERVEKNESNVSGRF